MRSKYFMLPLSFDILCVSNEFKTVFTLSQLINRKLTIYHLTMPTFTLISIFPCLFHTVLMQAWFSSPPFLMVLSTADLLAHVSFRVPSHATRNHFLFSIQTHLTSYGHTLMVDCVIGHFTRCCVALT